VKTVVVAAFLGLAVYDALLLPAPHRLELYDVQDLTYTLADAPSVDIRLVGSALSDDEDLCFVGTDLADGLAAVIPGLRNGSSDRTLQFQNGLLIVRGTAAQQLAIRAGLGVIRAALGIRNPVHAFLNRVKTAICASVFGMITG
jgi:hypothetical protein